VVSSLTQQQVPEGYQQTEVGLIPSGWDVKTIGDLTSDVGDGIHSTPVYSSSGAYYFVNGNNIVKGAIRVTDDTKRVDENEFKKHKKSLSLRTIFLSINGTIGNLAFYNNEPLVLGKSAAYMNVKEQHSLEYVYYGLQTKSTNDFFSDGLTGSTIKNLGLGIIRATPIPMPANPEEQTAIANVLSDVDALITSLEKLIAKKRAIKTAAMQQLLTGKKRLPPFDQSHTGYKQTELGEIPADWEVNYIGRVLSITTGDKNTQDKIDDGLYPFFVRSQTIERINSYSFDGEAVLTAGDGVGTGKIYHYINGKFDYHQRVYLMHNFCDLLDGYYFYIFFSNNFYDRIMSMTAKSSVDSVRREMIADMKIVLPPIDEQLEISKALSDMDKEIDTLNKRLNKTQQLKQGMMQELLTGRTRLLKPEQGVT
jgi:type I restriction enzyme S subunit